MNEIITIVLFGIPLALAPCIAIALLIYFKDKYEKEPFRLLLRSFLFGALIVIPAASIEIGLNYSGIIDETKGLFQMVIYSFVFIALTEEFSKFSILRWYIYKKDEFNEPFDGIVYSVMISMGFAAIENIFYVLSSGVTVSFLRMFTAVPMHAACAVLMGFFAGMAKFYSGKKMLLWVGLLVAVVVHGLYDFFLFQYSLPWLALFSLVVLFLAVRLSFYVIRLQQKNSPFNPENQRNTFLNQDGNN